MAVPVEEKVIISLERYETLKREAEKHSRKKEGLAEFKKSIEEAAKELSSFLNFILKKTEEPEKLIKAFNAESNRSKVIYSDENEKYYIELEDTNNND